MIRFILFSISMLFTTLALAINKNQLELVKSDVRPTPAQIMSHKENFEGINPVFHERLYLSDIPKVIVALEKAFPNGTYAFLGRDMDLVADAVEAFYLSIGQTDRVKRIRFSTPSMAGATAPLITDFLAQSGLNIGKDNGKPPMVIVDYTGFEPQSQSTMILLKTLNELERRGIPAEETLSRLNLATIESIDNSVDILTTDPYPLEKFLSEQKQEWRDQRKIDTILRISVGSIAYDSEWHDKYGPIHALPDGTLTTSPLGYFDESTKFLVFQKMAGAINLAISHDFKKRVSDIASENYVQIAGLKVPMRKPPYPATAAEKLEYEAKLVRDAEEAIRAEEEKKIKKEIKNKIANERRKASKDAMDQTLAHDLAQQLKHYSAFFTMPQYDSIAHYDFSQSSNALEFSQLLFTPKYKAAKHFTQIAFASLLEGYRAGKLSSEDFASLLLRVLEYKTITDPALIEEMRKHKKLEPMDLILHEMIGMWLVNEKGTLGDNYRLLVGKRTLAPLCRSVLLH